MTLLLLPQPLQLPPVAVASFGGAGRSTITTTTTTISTMTTMTMVRIHQNTQQTSGIVCLNICWYVKPESLPDHVQRVPFLVSGLVQAKQGRLLQMITIAMITRGVACFGGIGGTITSITTGPTVGCSLQSSRPIASPS